jgi:hypothetical protein
LKSQVLNLRGSFEEVVLVNVSILSAHFFVCLSSHGAIESPWILKFELSFFIQSDDISSSSTSPSLVVNCSYAL